MKNLFQDWLKYVSRRSAGKTHIPRSRSPRIRVELLEQREVPATSVFSFSSPTYSVTESTTTITIDITRSTSGTGNATTQVNYALSDGTATGGDDYIASSGTVQFNGNQPNQSFTVSILNDDLLETDETINLSLTAINSGDSVSPTAATAVLTILANDNAPVAANDAINVAEDTAFNGAVSATDVDGDPLAYSVVDQPTHGSVTMNLDGTFVYTPAAEYSGPDSFTFVANDGAIDSNVATVSINVNAVNDAPAAVDLAINVDEDTAFNGAVSATDVDGDPLAYSVVDQPTHGSVTMNLDGTFVYTPAAEYSGPDSFTFVANDGAIDSNVATVSINVDAVNDVPAAVDLAINVDEDAAFDGAVSATDADSDPLAYSVVDQPTHGSVTMNLDGTFTYTPTANYNGSDSFTFVANDGTIDSNVATVTITVDAVNDVPAADDLTINVDEDTAFDGAVSATDSDSDALTYSVVDQPTHGSVVMNLDGTFTYTPTADYNGPDSFTFKANDGAIDSNLATVTITVDAVNDSPVAADQAINVDEDIVFNGAVTATDVDGDTLAYSVVDQPAHGSVTMNPDGTFTYTATANYSGPDSFTFVANDGTIDSNLATVTIGVTNDNLDPLEVVTSPGNVTFVEGQGPVFVDPGIQVGSAEGLITRATVQITSGLVRSQDRLRYLREPLSPIRGSYNVRKGVLTLKGRASPAEYEAALQKVVYFNKSVAPNEQDRILTFRVTDSTGVGTPATRELSVVAFNTAPELYLADVIRTYRVGANPIRVSGIRMRDIDNPTMNSAKVFIGSGLQVGDLLTWKDRTGITGNYDEATGILTFTGTASRSDYRAVLRSIRFSTTTVGLGARDLKFSVQDAGGLWSNEVTRTVVVIA